MSSSNKEASSKRYRLKFKESAQKEWYKLGPVIQRQFASKLKERLDNPEVEAFRLRGMPGCYKIKLRASGYRLVYEVIQSEIIVMVIAVGKRERGKVYANARNRIDS
ncbi:MAG: type II toxin-antitoxin system RelE/ParE family toxin [Pseudomonadaceae bacterium]|jgi:mRNA interferase RelE/StbE|nr:type II toxin-antitoxin system RelE/ParE family toxin [Pseudomonadaceae bacterium]